MTPPDDAPLFTHYALGELQLRHRVVMSSMTRGRARNAELAPTELHVEYYHQRATAGLVLTQGTWISPHAIGFTNAPGQFTERQVEGWRAAMGGFGPTDKTIETYDYLVGRLNGLALSHLHVGRALNDLSGTPISALQDTIGYCRTRFNGTLIANFGFDGASRQYGDREQAGRSGFLRQTVHRNPDLVRRLREGLALSASTPETCYEGGPLGYLDYPPLPELTTSRVQP